MRQYVTTLSGVALAGCSILYNPNNLGRDAHSDDAKQFLDANPNDARIDAPVTRDADPTMLTLLDVSPQTIYEGQGDGNSAPVMVVIHGHNIVDGFTVSITPASPKLVVGTPVRAENGDYIAVPVTALVDKTDASSATMLTITVDEPNAPQATLPDAIALQHLPELDAAGALAVTLPAQQRYSEIVAGGAVTFSGVLTGRAILHAMSKVSVGNITAEGGAANKTTAGTAGIGACGGGATGGAGGCTGLVGGGAGGAGGAGGGGGGFGGAGGGGASAGAKHGDPLILSYDGVAGDGSDRNQASGGGGGGTSLGATSTPGAGGGGGSTIELSAGGDVIAGSIDVAGGVGGAGAFLVAGAAGGGGGGAGGLVVLRSQGASVVTSGINAMGGAGGPQAGGGSDGGAGGIGRVRWDGATLTGSSTPPAHRAPSFSIGTDKIVTTVNPLITMYGTDGDAVDLYVIDGTGHSHLQEPTNVVFSGGAATFVVTMVDGYNKLCATTHGASHGTDIAETCVEIAFLP